MSLAKYQVQSMQVSSLFQGITLFKKVRCQIQYFEHSIEYW